MGGYIANFTVYTMAMIGLICFAVFVYKKFTDGTMRSDNTKFLSVEDSMSLSPRKTLHVVRAGNEKFLIASDIERTTLISKLGDSKPTQNTNYTNFEEIIQKSQPKYEQVQNIIEDVQPTQEIQTQNKVHLEPIKTKNKAPRNAVGKMDRRIPTQQPPQNNPAVVTLDFDKPANHGFSTMREMAKKINEL